MHDIIVLHEVFVSIVFLQLDHELTTLLEFGLLGLAGVVCLERVTIRVLWWLLGNRWGHASVVYNSGV